METTGSIANILNWQVRGYILFAFIERIENEIQAYSFGGKENTWICSVAMTGLVVSGHPQCLGTTQPGSLMCQQH